jgi:hypothetical protein
MNEELFEIQIKDEGTPKERHELRKYRGDERVVKVPENVNTIYFKAFGGCDGVEEICLPAYVRSIDSKAFWGCNALKRITIMRKSVGLSSEAFDGTPTNLEIVFAGSSESWQNAIKPFTVVSHSYDNGWGGGAPGVYTYETTYYPMAHALKTDFVCHVKCLEDGVELHITGDGRSVGPREISTPYDR